MPRGRKSQNPQSSNIVIPSQLLRDVCRYIKAVRCIPALTHEQYDLLNNEYYKLTGINLSFNRCPKCWNDAITLLNEKYGDNWYRQDDSYFQKVLNAVDNAVDASPEYITAQIPVSELDDTPEGEPDSEVDDITEPPVKEYIDDEEL